MLCEDTTIGVLSATNPNDATLTFAIRSLAALTVVSLTRVSTTSANITLTQHLDIWVCLWSKW